MFNQPTRLQQSYPDVANRLARASAAKQRAAVVEACRTALAEIAPDDPDAVAALAALQRGQPELDERLKAETLAGTFDEKYYAAEESLGGDAHETLRLFSLSRFYTAVSCLMEQGPDHIQDALYEAFTTLDDPKVIIDAVVRSLSQ